MSEETWDDYLRADDAVAAAADSLASADTDLSNAAQESDFAQWHESTGDYWAQNAEESLEDALESAASGSPSWAAQQFENAERQAGLAGAEYENAADHSEDASTYTEWAGQDIAAAETELADTGYTDTGYSDTGYDTGSE